MKNQPNLPPVFQAFEQQQKQKKKNRNVIKWILGILLLITGIGLTAKNPLSGISLLLSGMLLLPPAILFLEKLLKRSIRPIVKYFTVVALLLISVVSSDSKLLTDNDNKTTDSSKPQNEPVANTTPSEFQDYLNRSESAIAHLSDAKKAARKKALDELKNDSTYIELVDKEVINQKYLIVLQAVGECMTSIKSSDNTFNIPISTETELKKLPAGLQFVINTVILQNLGGVSEEILKVYSRYLLTYQISGSKGNILYHKEPSSNETISTDYTLAPALVIFQPRNKSFLYSYYEAVQYGSINWYDDDNISDYKYPYLRNKFAFNEYLRNNYPDSKYFVNYDLITTASTLWDDYEANEVSADEKYKNKVVAIKGTIESIRKDFMDEPYLVLDAGGYLRSVQCSFKDGKALKSLSKGDNLTVVGTCTGRMLTSVIVSDSRIF